MKVLLINPPTFNIIRESLPPIVEDSTGVYPPLGLLYVAAYAEEVSGCQIQVTDCQAQKMGMEDVAREVRAFRPDVVGIQTMTFTLIDCLEVARIVRRTSAETLIVFGGPHPTLFPQETVDLAEVDAVVYGEGEYPFQSLLMALQENHPLNDIPGVIVKGAVVDPQWLNNMRYIQDLDSLKMPAWHLLDLDLYSSPLATKSRITTMMSSRGCPGRCVFCDRPQMGRIFRRRSAHSVVGEMTHCVEELGVKEIKFYDDTFTIDKQRVIDICDIIITTGLSVNWEIRARVDTMNPEMIAGLRKAGCMRIHYGVETGSPRLQKLLRKNLDLAEVKRVFALTHQEGIETLGYFMIGLPTEREHELHQTLELMTSLPMDYAHISIFTPYPGTEIYAKAIESGFYADDHWKVFASHPSPTFQPRYWNEHFSDDELFMIMKQAYYSFYRRPGYILRRLLKVRSFNDFLRKARLGVALLREVSK